MVILGYFHISMDSFLFKVLIVDLDNHKFLQRKGDEKTILPKKLHRSLVTALDMAKSGKCCRQKLSPLWYGLLLWRHQWRHEEYTKAFRGDGL